jgi:hypothetical protein
MADYPKGDITKDRFGELQGARFNFAGMNFLTDQADITLESGQCVDLCNVDVDYAYNVSRRPGCTQVIPDHVTSLWEGDDNTYCVSDGLLTRFTWNTLVSLRTSGNATVAVSSAVVLY